MPNRRPMNKSGLHKKRFYILFSFFVMVLFVIISQQTTSNEITRSIGSTSSKNDSLQPKSELLRHTKKLELPINIELTNLNSESMEAHQPFTLRATIQTNVLIKDFTSQWHIPNGVEVVQGQSKISSINLKPGDEEFFEITLRSDLEKNERIHFSFNSQDNSSPYNKTVQFNTLNQEEIEMTKQETLNRNIEYQLKSKKQKVFH